MLLISKSVSLSYRRDISLVKNPHVSFRVEKSRKSILKFILKNPKKFSKQKNILKFSMAITFQTSIINNITFISRQYLAVILSGFFQSFAIKSCYISKHKFRFVKMREYLCPLRGILPKPFKNPQQYAESLRKKRNKSGKCISNQL